MKAILVDLRPLEVEHTNLSSRAADVLREAIIRSDLPPGTRLVEQEIAEQLGISRMPVRQAIQQLADEGLVEKPPGKGAFVQRYSARDLDELYSLRIVLEQFAIELVMASDRKEELVARLNDVVDAMAEAAASGDKLRVYELDAEFHEALVTMTDHRLLLEILSVIRSRSSRALLQGILARSPQDLTKHVHKHRRLAELLEHGDIDAVREMLHNHILEGKSRIKADPTEGTETD